MLAWDSRYSREKNSIVLTAWEKHCMSLRGDKQPYRSPSHSEPNRSSILSGEEVPHLDKDLFATADSLSARTQGTDWGLDVITLIIAELAGNDLFLFGSYNSTAPE